MALSREEKLAKIQALEEKKRRLLKAKPAYVPNEGQLKVHQDDRAIRIVASGNGCWAKGTKFRMADGGVINVEDIQPGDQLLGPDGTARTVLEIHSGQEEMFEIIPKHTEKYTVNKSHVLSVYVGPKSHLIYSEPTVLEYLRWEHTKQQQTVQWKINFKTGKIKYEPFKIKSVGVGTYYGFSVDKDQLILKHDYVIQHNSGKTTLGVQEAFWIAKGYNPVLGQHTKVPALVIVVLDAPTKADDVWLPEAKKWFDFSEINLNKRGRPYTTEWEFKNGSRIMFMSHQQEPMAFESIQLTAAIFDEPPPKYCFTGLLRGARQRGVKPKMLFIGTPLGQPWLYNDLWLPAEKGDRPDVGIYRYSTKVNEKNLAAGYLTHFERNLSEKEKQARIEGHFMHLESLALAHLFSEKTHCVTPFNWPKGKPVVIAIDPAFSKAHTAVMVGSVGDGRLYYIKEFQSKSPPKELARELRDWYQGYRVVDIICDSMSSIPTTGGDGNKSLTEVLREGGIPLRTTDFAEKNDTDFMQRIMQVLEIPDKPDKFGRMVPVLAIFDNCPGIIKNIESVTWQKQRGHDMFKSKLDIASKDFLACLKYALTTHISLMTETLKKPQTYRPNKSPWSGASRIS